MTHKPGDILIVGNSIYCIVLTQTRGLIIDTNSWWPLAALEHSIANNTRDYWKVMPKRWLHDM